MKTKEAIDKFNITGKEIYKLGNFGWSGVKKKGREWIVSDDEEILISVNCIRAFLYHVLRFKNNEGYVFPRKMCPDDRTLVAIINQQYRNGLVGDRACGDDFNSILNNIKLTDEGFDLVFGKAQSNKLNSCSEIKINMNPNINIGLNVIVG